MKRFLSHPSRIVAALASALTVISSLTLIPLPAQAAEVVNGSCAANVDNTSGVSTYDDGTYCFVAFKTAGTTYNWSRPSPVTSFNLLVVGGGGGGAVRHAGGGGAGGLIEETGTSITSTSLTISVGAGGAGAGAQGAGVGAEGSNGVSTTVSGTGFTTRTAVGGGAGSFNLAPSTGGSGGGGGTNYTGANGTTGQGNAGGGGFNSGATYYGGGGGGGAGAVGGTSTNASSQTAGSGGTGLAISWISPTVQSALSVGVTSSSSVYFAGGGGGSVSTVGTGGTGGLGGGGTGGSPGGAGVAGTANTGGGGGAGAMNVSGNTSQASGAGGSGVVVIRYAKQAPVLDWNASDVNSYDESVSTAAINGLSSTGLNGTLYNGSNAVAPTFTNSTGAWNFSGGANSTGPYAKLNSNLNTTQFATNGMTIDFEADFGSSLDMWERILDFSTNADAANNLLISRRANSSDLILQLYSANNLQGDCTQTGAIPANSGMNRWTISIDGTNCRVYKNGTLLNSYAYSYKPITGLTWSTNYIARSNWSSDTSFEGSIRSLRIYAGGLSPSEMPAPVAKSVTFNAFDGNAQNGGGVTNNLGSPRLTTGSVKLPTPITRAGYTFTGWYSDSTFATRIGSAGATYTPSNGSTLYGGWRTVDSGVVSNLVVNFDATNISSFPVAATSANSIWPASSTMAASSVSNTTRNASPGSMVLPNTNNQSVVGFPAGGAANFSGALSFETWVNFSTIKTGASAWNVIASHWFSDTSGTGSGDWHFAIYNNRLQVNTGATNTTIGSKVWSSTTDINKWYLIGFTIDASNTVQIYVNGRADGAAGLNKPRTPDANALLWIGDGRTNNTVRMAGEISRARLYNTSLTGAQMLSNFSGEAVTYGMGPYTLTYKAGPNGSGADVVETYNAGTSVTLKNNTAPFTRAGYYISGWTTGSTSGAAQTNALTSSYTMDANTILYPVWTATTYTVTYNYNGATGSATTVSNTYAAGGTAITLPTPTKTNSVFNGWFTEVGLTNQVTSPYSPTADITLYAKWTSTPYTVTFKVNGGNAAADVTQTVYAGTPVALTLNTFTKAHSQFGRWSDLASGLSLNMWTDGQTITATGNLTLYAIWYDDARIIFNSEGGTAVADAYTIGLPLAGATPLAKPTDPTKAGKIFGGWSTTESSGNGVVTNVVAWPRDYEMNAVETLYAIWLDACAPTKTTFTATGTSDLTSATYGTNGLRYMQYRINSTTQCALSVPSEVSAFDVLMVAGGGAGSYYNRAGGGGAGTLMHTNVGGMSVTAGDVIPVKVGEGGTVTYVGAVDGNRGSNGGFTTFGNYRITGGGAGAGGYGTVLAAQPGGSGGGGACATGYGSGGAGGIPIYSGWTGYANSGGNATYADCTQSGASGGGGAGGYPGNATATGGASLTRFGLELAGGGAGWWPGATRQGGGNVGGDWTNTCPASPSGANDGVANTGSGGGSCGNGAAGTIIVRFVAPTYSVSYTYNNATGGNSITSSNFVMGDAALTLPTPTRLGYAFGGWYSDSGFTTLVGAAGASYTPTADITLHAKWTTATYTVTYNYNSATSGNSTANSTYQFGGSTITLPSPSKTGYTFGGWYTEAGLTNSVSTPYTPSADITLYAKWTAGTFTLTYNYNNATGGNGNASASYTTGGSAITLPTPTRTGYTFGGWYSESAFTNAITGTQTPSADATLYAKWTAVNYTLTYNANSATGGTVPTDSTNYNIGQNATVLGNSGSLVRTGYTFAGWTLAANGSGTVYSSGQALAFGSANQTLYAKWNANTYAISYNVNGASGTQANSSDSYTTAGSAVTLSAVGTMVKTGYNFAGWSTTPTGSVIAGTYTTTADVTLYAIWTIRSINVSYAKGTASSASFISFPSNTSANYGTRITLSNAIDSTTTYSSATWAFVGWSDGTSMYQAGTQYLLGANDVTFTAIWTQAFGVRYTFNGGTPANGTSAMDSECMLTGSLCTDGQSITANAAPTRDGYTFSGWTDQSGNPIAAGASFTVNINSYLLYAGWTAINYNITYSSAGGSAAPTQVALHYGDTFTVGAAVTRTDYIFGGWSDGTATYGAGATYTVGLSAITFTAQWTPRTYTVTYDWNGGTGSAVANPTYTVGNSGLTLTGVTDHVKDGYQFGGWSLTIGGDAVVTPFIPTGDVTVYAIWGTGSYAITYNLNYGVSANSVVNVSNGSSTVLGTPSRANFVFDGWYTASTGGTKVGNGGAAYTPAASRTLYARWIQASLYGVTSSLNRISTITASDSVSSSYSGTVAGSSVAVSLPSATLPAGTVVALDVITDTSYAQTLLTGTNNYILSIAVSWLAPDETVPNTNSGKSVSMTITNSSIRAGALVYSVQSGVVTLLGTATQDGTITVQLTSDPSVYVVATVPSVPRTIANSPSSNSATITWTAPSTDGGDPITGYTVTLNTGTTCTTSTLTCVFNNLTVGTPYTATVVANNSIGSSVTGSTSFTLTAPQSSGGVVTPPVVIPPKQVEPTDPVVPAKPVVVPVPLVRAVQKVLAHNVPVLTGTPLITPILFAPNSAKLDAADIKQIAQAAALLKDKSGWLFVTGFVKYEGKGTAIEKKIANARATAVAKRLAKHGLKVKIGYLGYGPQNKKAPKPTDRKVELRWLEESSQNS